MDKERFTREILKAEKSLYRTAKAILINDEDVKDAVQNAVMRAFEKLSTLRQDKYFKTWLTRILVNECYMLLRKRHYDVPYEEYEENGIYAGYTERAKVYAEDPCDMAHSDIYMALNALMDTYRLPFVLHYIEGYSVKEIAASLNITQSTVKTRLYRARESLKDMLSENGLYEL